MTGLAVLGALAAVMLKRQHQALGWAAAAFAGAAVLLLALDKLGATVATYYATEIDKYAVQTIQHNFPETIQLGDAFQVRDDDWRLGEEL